MVGILLTGWQKLGVKLKERTLTVTKKTFHCSSIFLSIFRAYGIPLLSNGYAAGMVILVITLFNRKLENELIQINEILHEPS